MAHFPNACSPALGSCLTRGGARAYEVKWDGFRAIVSTEGTLRVRSRRGWNMTEHVGFLAELPVRAVLDGELGVHGGERCAATCGSRNACYSSLPAAGLHSCHLTAT
jgi:ATP-dependent DNA ligase